MQGFEYGFSLFGLLLGFGTVYPGPAAFIVPGCFCGVATALMLVRHRLASALLLALDIGLYWIFRYL